VSFKCLDRVRGAAWIITARRRQERRQRYLIAANEKHEESSHTVLRVRRVGGDTRLNEQYICPQRGEGGRIRVSPSANRHVHGGPLAQIRQELDAHELAQPPLESVAINGRLMVTWYDNSDSRKCERGSEDSHVEMCGPNSLPLANDGLNVEAPRQSIPTRKTEAVVTRLRTCSGA
jgi:hypothetical protein